MNGELLFSLPIYNNSAIYDYSDSAVLHEHDNGAIYDENEEFKVLVVKGKATFNDSKFVSEKSNKASRERFNVYFTSDSNEKEKFRISVKNDRPWPIPELIGKSKGLVFSMWPEGAGMFIKLSDAYWIALDQTKARGKYRIASKRKTIKLKFYILTKTVEEITILE